MTHVTNEQLIDYIHNALEPAEDARLLAHLEACTQCRRQYDAEVTMGDWLRIHAEREERELPPMVKASIWARVRSERPAWSTTVAAWLRPAYAFPVAAALIFAAIFGPAYLHSRPSAAPSIEAAYYLQDHAAMNTTLPFSEHPGANTATFVNDSTLYTDQASVAVKPAAYTADAAH